MLLGRGLNVEIVTLYCKPLEYTFLNCVIEKKNKPKNEFPLIYMFYSVITTLYRTKCYIHLMHEEIFELDISTCLYRCRHVDSFNVCCRIYV